VRFDPHAFCQLGSFSTGAGHLLAYDLVHAKILWTRSYSNAIDSHSVAPDGSIIYMPSGAFSGTDTWYLDSAASGADVGKIFGPKGPHNTIVSPTGTILNRHVLLTAWARAGYITHETAGMFTSASGVSRGRAEPTTEEAQTLRARRAATAGLERGEPGVGAGFRARCGWTAGGRSEY